MTVDGGLSDFAAIIKLSDKAPMELIDKLIDFSTKQKELIKCKKCSN